MLLAVRMDLESLGALKKLELLSATPRATLTLLSCSPNFPRASTTRHMHAKHEPFLKWLTRWIFKLAVSSLNQEVFYKDDAPSPARYLCAWIKFNRIFQLFVNFYALAF